MRRDRAAAINALDRAFAQHRVSLEEWREAMRLIRTTNETFLRHGVAERFIQRSQL